MKVSGKVLSANFICEKTAQNVMLVWAPRAKPISQSPSIDVKAVEGVSGCCLTIVKCQKDTSVTKMGKPFL